MPPPAGSRHAAPNKATAPKLKVGTRAPQKFKDNTSAQKGKQRAPDGETVSSVTLAWTLRFRQLSDLAAAQKTCQKNNNTITSTRGDEERRKHATDGLNTRCEHSAHMCRPVVAQTDTPHTHTVSPSCSQMHYQMISSIITPIYAIHTFSPPRQHPIPNKTFNAKSSNSSRGGGAVPSPLSV